MLLTLAGGGFGGWGFGDVRETGDEKRPAVPEAPGTNVVRRAFDEALWDQEVSGRTGGGGGGGEGAGPVGISTPIGKVGISTPIGQQAEMQQRFEDAEGPGGYALHPTPSTLNPQPSTLNPQPSTLNPQPSTLSPKH